MLRVKGQGRADYGVQDVKNKSENITTLSKIKWNIKHCLTSTD